jgi:hypothetical protein
MKQVVRDLIIEAMSRPENLLENGDVNWNFVDADVFLALMDEPFLPDHKLAELIDEVSFEIIDEGV